jgi:hypothetical protein
LHEVMGNPNREQRKRIIAGLADNLDGAQIREALGRVIQSRIPNRKEVMDQLFARWGEIEPLAAMEFAKSLTRRSDKHDATIAILNGWMEVDPAAAEKWAGEQPNGALRNTAWETIIVACAADDPMHALALAQKIGLPWGNTRCIGETIFGPWAERDPAGAAAQATQLPKGYLRTDAQCVVAIQWAETDPARAIAWAESLPDLLPNNPEGFVMTTSVGAERSNTAKRIVDTWLKRDPDAAIRWLSQLPDDPWKTLMLINACTQNIESAPDPRIALQLANLLPEGGRRTEALYHTADRLGQIDTENALALLSLEMSDQAKRPIISGLAENLKGEDLLSALSQAQARGFPLGDASRWADPETAIGWAVQQSDNEKYLPKIAAAWMAKDPERAQEFVRTLPVPVKDGALSGAVESSLYRGPESPQEMAKKFERTGQWIPEIADPTLRQTTYRKLAQRWLQVEPESAHRWIDSIPISAELKSELLKNLPNTK